MKNADNKSFIFLKPNVQAELRLFCFPYSGSGAFAYRNWPDHLPSQVEVCAVQLPGRENRLRERAFSRLEPLIYSIASGIRPFLDKPFVLFGHSLGALIAFELARELRRCYGAMPEYLLVSARSAPQLTVRGEPVHALPHQQFIERLRDFNGTPEAVLHNDELMELLVPVLRADFEINETYEYHADTPLSCPIAAYRGAHDPNTGYEETAAWGEHTSATFTVRTIPGDHFFIHSAANQFWRILTYDLGHALGGLNGHVPVSTPATVFAQREVTK
jgi:medium-chain acyl-[acyl-carrier-protein] hydrolase